VFLTANGYEILEEKCTVMPLELVLGVSPDNRVFKLLNRCLALFTRLVPGLLGYQIMFVARSVR